MTWLKNPGAAAAVFAAVLLLWSPAQAGEPSADCKPLTLVSSVDLVPAENTSEELVPVEINGTPKLMLLDTGGVYTEITSDAVDELKLPERRGGFELYDVSGFSTSKYTMASFKLGLLHADKVAFVITGAKFSDDPRVAGLLAPDILSHYDVSLDFGANKLDLLSQDHCAGPVVYWPAAAVAVIPIEVLESKHIVISVVLDGHRTSAILDTGAADSTLSQPAAVGPFGITLGSPDSPRNGELPGRPGAYTYSHIFKSLDLEGIAVSNIQVTLIPNFLHKLENAPPIDSRIPDRSRADDKPDMLIGMNVLRHLHIYIDYKNKVLYVTPAAAPATAK